MQIVENITMEEICGKKFQVRLIEKADNDKAAFTHFLHNQNGYSSVALKKGAVSHFKKALKYKFPKESISNKIAEEALQGMLFDYRNEIPFPHKIKTKFTFIDLFAGIGGFRMAMQNLGGKCVYSSEWDEQAKTTYFHNFGEIPFGDITKNETKNYIPKDFDLLCAGFPCQPFSIAGYRKGFSDKGRGDLFFEIVQILKEKKPKMVLLENVKNLKTHNDGKTLKLIYEHLEKIGYYVKDTIINTAEYGNLPQNRERIYIVGFLSKDESNKFHFPKKTKLIKTIHSCLIKEKAKDRYYYNDKPLFQYLNGEVIKQDTVYQWRRKYVRENKSNVCPTLTAYMGTGGHNVPIITDEFGIRKLTPRECANFQGFDKKYILPNIADSQLYKQIGNSVSVPVVERVVNQMMKAIK